MAGTSDKDNKTERPLVEFKNITKKFGDFTAVNDISLKINSGEFFALLGPSGCGKSTLLRMLAGFENPTSGSIFLDGKDISATPPNLRPVNMMFQSYALFPHLSVQENIAFGLRRSNLNSNEIAERTQEMLKLVRMQDFAKRKPHQMSGGQRQRVALARSLAKNPKLLLLDEPLGALDAKLREATQFELVNIQEKLGTTFIIVTHDQEEAMTVATQIGVMNEGKILQIDSPADIYENPKSKFVSDFIGGVNLIEGVVGKSNKDISYLLPANSDKSDFPKKLSARNDLKIDEGENAALAIRPEKISVSKTKPTKADNLLSGIVEDIAYTGNLSTYYVRLANGSLIKAQETNIRRIANRDITWEDKVWLTWSSSGGLLLVD